MIDIRRNATLLATSLAVAIAIVEFGSPSVPQAQAAEMNMTATASGLQITDTTPGTGASPNTGDTCVMHYTGWLRENGTKGRKFD